MLCCVVLCVCVCVCQGGFEGWGRLPAGVKFDPSDQQILEHLDAKVKRDKRKLHPLLDEFIPTLDGEDGICYTHPQNLPGNSFFFFF